MKNGLSLLSSFSRNAQQTSVNTTLRCSGSGFSAFHKSNPVVLAMKGPWYNNDWSYVTAPCPHQIVFFDILHPDIRPHPHERQPCGHRRGGLSSWGSLLWGSNWTPIFFMWVFQVLRQVLPGTDTSPLECDQLKQQKMYLEVLFLLRECIIVDIYAARKFNRIIMIRHIWNLKI